MIMANTKPFVQAASVCEKILIEPDGVASLIRMVDVFHLDLESTPVVPNIPPGMQFAVVIALKSGDVAGNFDMGVRLVRPSGKVEDTQNIPVVLQGGGHGANIRINVVIANPEYGLHWFDVLWSGEILTRIPLDLKKAKPSQTNKPEA